MGRIVLVSDPSDELQLGGRLEELHSLPMGRCHAALTIEHANLETLANTILGGLGKRVLGRDLQRNATAKFAYAQAWLQGDGIRDIFLSGIGGLDHHARARIPDLYTNQPLNVWLICSRPRTEKLLAQIFGVTAISAQEFVAEWRVADAPPEQVTQPPYPAAPEEEFVRARLAYYRELPPDDYAVVNRTWRHIHTHITEWLADIEDREEESMAAELQRILSRCGEYNEGLVSIRAAQAALLCHGWLLKVRLERFAYYTKKASRADLTGGDLAQRLRWYNGSARPSAALIRLLAPEASLVEIAEMHAAAVDPDGASFTVDAARIEVPAPGQGILRAQFAARTLLQMDQSSDRFLLYRRGHRTQEPTPNTIRHWLREVTTEAGINVATQFTERITPTAYDWVRRRGLYLARL